MTEQQPGGYQEPAQPGFGQGPYGAPADQDAYGASYAPGAQPPQQPYGAPAPYGAGAPYERRPEYGFYGYVPMEHPQAQMVFILSIVGIFTGILPFVAWYLGAQAKKEIEAGAPYPWDGKLKTGYQLGKVFGILNIVGIGLAIIFWVLYIVFFVWIMQMTTY